MALQLVVICCRSALLAQGVSTSVNAVFRDVQIEIVATSNLKLKHFLDAALVIADNVAIRRELVEQLSRVHQRQRKPLIVLSQRKIQKISWSTDVSPLVKPMVFETLLRNIMSGQATREPPAELTETQERVVQLLALGMINKEIAYEMSISEATVRTHLTAIYRKLRVHNRTEASIVAREYFSTHPH
ncbi:MAG: response regulator transcription factor [Gammaproteobacteria bacterium]|nr:response regulator transcription factor [Gammaproteobacteria bacterium]